MSDELRDKRSVARKPTAESHQLDLFDEGGDNQ